MRYSLVSRFRGALLGAFLGESLASGGVKESQSACDLGKMAILGTESLISLGRLDVDDWLERQQQASLHFNADSTAKVILATLPVALFFHENPIQLRKNLLLVLQIWDDNQVLRDAVLALGYAIAQSLTEKLDPPTLIPRTIAFLGKTSTSIPQTLLKVNNLLAKKAELARAQLELSQEDKLSNTTAMAFYCFLDTLEDFRLTVLRASSNHNSQIAEPVDLGSPARSAITGALSGAYNSMLGIPVNWQVLLSTTNSPTWGLSNCSQMLKLADTLAVVWSGVYDFALTPSGLIEQKDVISVFASPRVIRSR
jgi:ADP-ribosylglycohydrolase